MENSEQRPERDKWANKVEFVLSCIGLSIGLGNIWRFPYLTYENGGAAFLVPYIFLIAVLGRPIYLMELILGQFCSFASVKSFACVPFAQGVPLVMMYAVFFLGIYYNVILGYSLTYLYYSFWKILPWTECNPDWTNEYCFVQGSEFVTCKEANHSLLVLFRHQNSTDRDAVAMYDGPTVIMVPHKEFLRLHEGCKNVNQTSTEQFFYKRFLALTSGVEEMGAIQPEIFVSLIVAWVIVFLTICKGIQSSGKVAFFTAVVPILILGVLLTRGVTLQGANWGLAYYLLPDWKKILDYAVWQKAAEQVFFSLGVAQGMTITMGSYNDFSNNLYKDVYIIVFADLLVSFVGGIVVFSVLGNMAYNLRLAVPDVVNSGFGLAFITYPQAVSALMFPNLWAAAFFTMLFFLALGSEIAFVESLLTPLKDSFDYLQQHRTMLAAAACFLGFVLGIPLTTQGGLYLLNVIDTEVGGELLRWIAVFETVYIAIGYGIRRLSLDAEFMMGGPTGWPVQFCWTYVCPLLLAMICISSLIASEPLTLGNYMYPKWLQIFGKLLVVFPILAMLGGAFVHLARCKWNYSEATKPRPEWGPKNPDTLKRYRLFLFERGVVPPGMTKADHEPLKNAMAVDAAAVAAAVGTEEPGPDASGAPPTPPAPSVVGAAAPAGNADDDEPADFLNA
ncbi:sodium- and chloride-dependent glycine transporter 2-like [Amblyomma americanum]